MQQWRNANIYFQRTLAPLASITIPFVDASVTDDNGVNTRTFAEPSGLRNLTILNYGNANVTYQLNNQGLRYVPAGVIDDRSEAYAKVLTITNTDAANNAELIIQLNNEQTQLSVLKRLAGGGNNE